MTTDNTSDKKAKDQIKERSKKANDVKTFSRKDAVKEAPDLLKILSGTFISMIKQLSAFVQEILYPNLLKFYHKYVSYDQSNTSGLSVSSLHTRVHKIKGYVQYIPLALELYCMMFHVFIIRVWIMMNFVCTVLYMYDNLSESDIDQRVIPVGIWEIRKLASFIIGTGIGMMICFTQTVGFFTLPLIMYLINRTSKNIFNKGF